MSDRFIEKSFLYLLGVSLLLHAAVFALFYYAPPATPPVPKEPVFIDLQNMPELKQQQTQQETKRRSERQVRVEQEQAPKGNAAKDNTATTQPTPPTRQSQAAAPAAPRQAQQAQPQAAVTPGSSIASLLKPKATTANQNPAATAQLFPSANRLAKLEESYRRKFENDIAEGDTKFLNSDDIMFGSFLRRFEGAVYGVWRYPQEAALRGIEGITPVRITFNRRGEITHIQQLESSGARILDEEVLRTLRALGPMGGFPKGYDKDEFHLIAFFQYGGARRSLR
jgi:protein TonB